MTAFIDQKVALRIFPKRALAGKLLRIDYQPLEIRTATLSMLPPVGCEIFLQHHSSAPDLRIQLTVLQVALNLHLKSPHDNQWLIAARASDDQFDYLKQNYKQYV